MVFKRITFSERRPDEIRYKLRHFRNGISCIFQNDTEDGGWKYNLLTEDIEFSTDHIIRGHKIGYCKDAILYDEQPVTFRASWNQRLRWTKGFYQVFANYGGLLCKGIARDHSFQCYDMLMVIAPATLLTLTSLLANIFFALLGVSAGNMLITETAAAAFGGCLLSIYVSLFAFGAVTLLAEQKRIYWQQA